VTYIAVRCPHCQSEQIVKRGCLPEVKQQIIDMSLNASGVRDTARVLRISTDTVLNALKKKAAALESVNTALLRILNPDDIAIEMRVHHDLSYTVPSTTGGTAHVTLSRYSNPYHRGLRFDELDRGRVCGSSAAL